MKKRLLIIFCVSAVFVLLVILVVYVFDTLGNSLCDTQSISSTPSPDGSKKIEVFVVNCGATTDWSTQASMLKRDEVIGKNSTGNLLAISGNHGETWPVAIQGWPIIVPVWENQDSVDLYYSQNTGVTPVTKTMYGVNITYKTLTSDFLKQNKIETR